MGGALTSFFDRRFEVLIDGEPIIAETSDKQFKVTFDIMLDYGGFISYADLGIYNLSDDTAGKVFKDGAVVSLRAGYVDTIDTLFKGRIRNVIKERNGPDRITRIIARGGSQPRQTIELTLGAGTSLVSIITACVTAMGYPVVIQQGDFEDVRPYARGYVLHGDPQTYLDQLARTHLFSYVVDNERVIITRNNSFRGGSPIIISQFTGMEGIPEITEIGCDVHKRLDPLLRIGGRVDIQSQLATFNFSNVYFQDIPGNAGTGVYRIFKLQHTGDSWGNVWTSRITGFR